MGVGEAVPAPSGLGAEQAGFGVARFTAVGVGLETGDAGGEGAFAVADRERGLQVEGGEGGVLALEEGLASGRDLGGGDGWEEFAARETACRFQFSRAEGGKWAWGRSDGCEVGL